MNKKSNRYLPLFIAFGIIFGVVFGIPTSIVKGNITLFPIFMGCGITLSILIFALVKKIKK